ncbi:MAG: hypothetical protein HQL95_12635 [Magnetococcales bacterium]|nr:hypothetical protein [Magnetococcales bacterium]
MSQSHAGGMTPNMTPVTPGMTGMADQGDATEMGQRMGKFMGSFMRELKSPNDRADSGEAWRGEPRVREPSNDSRRGFWREDEEQARRSNREVTRYVPLYDPWGADRGGWDLENLGSGSSYGRPYPPGYGHGWNESAPYGWGSDPNWDRARNYYGAGLAPWENFTPPPDPREERRWRDPSYYDKPDTRYVNPPPMEDSQYGPRSTAPWSNWNGRRGSWW